jgi:hypothetical protein
MGAGFSEDSFSKAGCFLAFCAVSKSIAAKVGAALASNVNAVKAPTTTAVEPKCLAYIEKILILGTLLQPNVVLYKKSVTLCF